MKGAATTQFRVLCGPRAGCWLPLTAGTYSVGTNDGCDIVLEGAPLEGIVFAIYVGHETFALEAVAAGVRLDGRPVRGLRELQCGALLEVGNWLFTVDETDSPWPKDPESLRPPPKDEEASSDVAIDRRLAADGAAAETVTAETVTAETAEEGAASESMAEATEQMQSPSLEAQIVARVRSKPPFWVLWLAGTAAFLGFGTTALVFSLTPAGVRQDPDATRNPQSALERLTKSAADTGDVRLEQLPDGRFRLAGRVATRRQKLDLLRQARASSPTVLIQIVADDDLEALARDTLVRFSDADVEFAGVHRGRLTVKGHVATRAARDQIVAALWDGVPGLSSVDAQVTANEESLAALRELLGGADLAARLSGRLDGGHLIVEGAPTESERERWRGVRGELLSRFGEQLPIVESFATPVAGADAPAQKVRPAVRGDIVAVVMGPVPYMLLRDGSKVATSAVEDGP